MTPVRPVDFAGQGGGEQQMHSEVRGSLSDSSRPWNKNHHQNTTCKERKPLTKSSKPTPNKPRTDEETIWKMRYKESHSIWNVADEP
jgi:hypothetical protein